MYNPLGILRDLSHRVKSGGKHDTPDVRNGYQRSILLDIPKPQAIDIEFCDITLTVPGKVKKVILKGVSGKIRSGELTAIMGPSGAGKSSLLNALTGFCSDGITGKINAGGIETLMTPEKQSKSSFAKHCSYILQDDMLNPLFTVEEIMTMAAHLKLGGALSEVAKQKVINDILCTLGLSATIVTRCGRLSGGQKKRLSIALELIDNPPVIFLDEPTTGLDSVSSSQCISTLKMLAREGRTIVCTIHQPSAKVYSIFDHVFVLAEGMLVYDGVSSNTIPFLSSVGLICPKYHNPADFMLEVTNCEYGNFNERLSIATREKNDETKDKVEVEPVHIEHNIKSNINKTAVLINSPSELYKFLILLNRCLMQMHRDWMITHLKLLLHIVVAVILGANFYAFGNDASKTLSNIGYYCILITYLCYTSMMPAVLKYPLELRVIKKENFNNWYKLRTYYAASLVSSMPIQIFFAVTHCSVSYFMTGQPLEVPRYIKFALVCILVVLVAESIGNVLGTTCNPVNGTFFGCIFLAVMLLFAGYLVFFKDMARVIYYISYLSYFRYAMEGLIITTYGYGRPTLLCPDAELYCYMKNPSTILQTLDMHRVDYWLNIGILFGAVIVLRTVSFFTLRRYVKMFRS